MGVLLTLFLAVAVLTVLKWLSQARFHYSHGIFYHRPCQLFMFELEQGHSKVLNEGPAAPNRFLLWCVRTASARTTTKKIPVPEGDARRETTTHILIDSKAEDLSPGNLLHWWEQRENRRTTLRPVSVRQ